MKASPLTGSEESQDGHAPDAQTDAYAQAHDEDNSQCNKDEWCEESLPLIGEDYPALHKSALCLSRYRLVLPHLGQETAFGPAAIEKRVTPAPRAASPSGPGP